MSAINGTEFRGRAQSTGSVPPPNGQALLSSSGIGTPTGVVAMQILTPRERRNSASSPLSLTTM